MGGLTVEVDSSRLPPLAHRAGSRVFELGLTLETGVPQSAIHEVFEFVEDDCDLKIEDISGVPAVVPQIDQTANPVIFAVKNSVDPAAAPSTPPQSIRVDVDKVDRLVNLVGELVITQAM